MKKTSVTALEVLQPPLPPAALTAKPARADARPTGIEQEVADLREMVTRLAGRVETLERIVAERGTVCCICGKPDCDEAPHVPMRYWMRYGKRASWDYYARDDREGAQRSEREYYRRRRGPGVMESMMLDMSEEMYRRMRGY